MLTPLAWATDDATVKADVDPATAADLQGKLDGSGTSADPFLIENEDDLQTLAIVTNEHYTGASSVNFADVYFKQTANITLSKTWNSIGKDTGYYFGGNYDGGGYFIDLGSYSAPGMYSAPVFGCTINAVISNLTSKGTINNRDDIGCYSAGIVGYAKTSVINNCKNYVDISGKGFAGGIVAVMSDGSVNNCINYGDITQIGSYYQAASLGGIIGKAGSNGAVNIKNCENYGNVDYGTVICDELSGSMFYIGGIAGSIGYKNSSIINCINQGQVGGAVATQNNVYKGYIGGLVGYTQTAFTLENSCNQGEVNANTWYVGGLIGYQSTAGTVNNCFNTGEVTNNRINTTSATKAYTGGISGYCSVGTKYNSCYNAGIINAQPETYSYVGTIIGYSSSSYIKSTYYNNCFAENQGEIATFGYPRSYTDPISAIESKDVLLSSLGGEYIADLSTPINDGYPILVWMNPNAQFAANFTVKDGLTGAEITDYDITVNGSAGAVDDFSNLGNGSYTYEIIKDNYQTVSGSFAINKCDTDINVTLNPVKYEYTFTINPYSDDVKFTLINSDEKIGEVTPISAENGVYKYNLYKAYGEYNWVAKCYGYEPQNGNIATNDVTTGNKEINLEKLESYDVTFEIKNQEDIISDASISVTNTDYNTVMQADSPGKYSLAPGNYSYIVRYAGLASQKGIFVVTDKDETIQVSLGSPEAWDGSVDTSWYNTKDTELYISTPAELAGLAAIVNGTAEDIEQDSFADKTIYLSCDLDLNNRQWTSIGNATNKSFSGTFDGKNHKIENYQLSESQYQGLFGYLNNATICDLNIKADVTVKGYSGLLAGTAAGGNYKNITTQGSITLTATSQADYVGGLIGRLSSGSSSSKNSTLISGCVNEADINVKSAYVGGIVGESYCASAIIEDCINKGDIISTKYNVGGIMGRSSYSSSSETVVRRCINEGTVSGTYTSNSYYGAGGIIGNLYGSNDKVENCLNLGAIGNDSVGITGLGGIVGYAYGAGEISNCYNRATITNAWSKGTSSTKSGTGGILGATNKAVEVTNCYNTASVINTNAGNYDYIGAIVGCGSGTGTSAVQLTNNWYLASIGSNEIGEPENIGNSFEQTLDVAKLGDAYCEDLAETINDGYPILRWQDPDAEFIVNFDLKLDNQVNDGGNTTITVKNSQDEVINAISDGKYQLPNGVYKYQVEKQGYNCTDGTDEGSFTVNKSGQTIAVNLVAEKYEYKFKVTENADFNLKDAEGKVIEAEKSNESGYDIYTYKLYNGVYSYSASRFGYIEKPEEDVDALAVTGDITVQYAGGEKTIDLEIDKDNMADLTINVDTYDSKDVEPSITILSKSGDYKDEVVYTGATLDNLKFPVGDYEYTVKATGYSKATGSFTLTKDEPKVINITLVAKTAWDGESVDTAWYTNNPDADTFYLYSEDDLAGLAAIVNGTADGIEANTFAGKTIKLMADINMGDNAWTPIGGYSYSSTKYFAGTFDGNNHIISINNGVFTGNETGFGLFGYIKGSADERAVVKNLILFGNVSAESSEYTYFGGLAGYATYTDFSNISNRMNIEVTVNTSGMGFIDLGGLVGWSVYNNFDCCSNTGNIIGTMNAGEGKNGMCYVGGIAGMTTQATSSAISWQVTNCYNTGDITSAGGTITYAGGLIGNASTGNSYALMANCYNSGVVKTATRGEELAAGQPMIGYGQFNKTGTGNNYFLDTTLGESLTSNIGEVKTSDELKDLADTLGDKYKSSSLYPVLYWEAEPYSIEVKTAPEKLSYNDMEDFNDKGLTLLVKYSKDDEGSIIESGWQIMDGNCLKPDQKEVTVSYMGQTCTIDIEVNQIEHAILKEELVFSVAAPVVGAEPQKEITLSDEQKVKIDSAEITWYANGQKMGANDKFEADVYYRAELTLKSHYVKNDVYYVFGKDNKPQVDGAYEILYTSRSKDNQNLTATLTYEISDKLSDKAAHSYYQGDENNSADYAQYLEDTLTINYANGSKTISVADIETMALKDGMENTYSCQGLNTRENHIATGLPLYAFLQKFVPNLSKADDSSIVTIGSKDFTLGELRKVGNSYNTDGTLLAKDLPYLLAYGIDGKPCTIENGPLCLVAPASNSADENNDKFVENINTININLVTSETFDVTLNAVDGDGNTIENAEVIITDKYNNIAEKGNAGTYTLRKGETYKYSITADGYGVKTGTINGAGTLTVTLLNAWDGKYTEPKTDENGTYLIYTVSELMWYNREATTVSNERSMEMMTKDIKLMADLDMSEASKEWLPMGCLNGDNVLYFYVVNPDLPKYYGSGGYQGTFDGNNHVITNFNIDWTNYYELELAFDGSVMAFSYRLDTVGGLFGQTTSNAVIKNVGLEGSINITDRPDSTTASWFQLGGLVGFMQKGTTISGCYTDMDLNYNIAKDESTVGGYSLSGYPEYCDLYIGGLVGSSSAIGTTGTIENCYTTGNIKGEGVRSIRAGGITGATRNGNNIISKCYSVSTIDVAPSYFAEIGSIPTYVGGIVGGINILATSGDIKTTVEYCFGLNPSLNISSDGDFDLSYAHANRVVGDENLGSNSCELKYNQGLYGMIINGATYTQGEDEQSFRSASGRSIQAERAQSSKAFTNVKWNEDAEIWQFITGEYPIFVWQKSNDLNGDTVIEEPDDSQGGSSGGSSGGGGSDSSGENQDDNQNDTTGVDKYTDIKESDWYYDAVKYVVENDLFYGVSNTIFAPNDNMTRAMFATVIYRLEGLNKTLPTNYGSSFKDVSANTWYTNGIGWASENQIVKGIGNDLFAPNVSISREQMAAMLYRYADYCGYDMNVSDQTLNFVDMAYVDDYALVAIQWAYENGLIKGKENNLLDPDGLATRAEVAAMLQRFANTFIK